MLKNTKWVFSADEKPTEFDLVVISGNSDNEYFGWWTGTVWDSKFNIKDEITRWRYLKNNEKFKG